MIRANTWCSTPRGAIGMERVVCNDRWVRFTHIRHIRKGQVQRRRQKLFQRVVLCDTTIVRIGNIVTSNTLVRLGRARAPSNTPHVGGDERKGGHLPCLHSLLTKRLNIGFECAQ